LGHANPAQLAFLQGVESLGEVARGGGTLPAVFNAANEIAVAAFLKERAKFHQIPDIVINTLEKHNKVESPSLDDIIAADSWGRITAGEMIS